jgi:chorismate-pyruvate lyase
MGNMKSGYIMTGLALLGLSLWGYPSGAGTAPAAASSHRQANSTTAHLEASLLLQTLNADLLSHDSATLTLERWCTDHRLAPSPRVVAERVPGADKEPTEEQRHQLGMTESDTIRYRKVKLVCGDVVLSEADNWYVPDRLTPEINKLLDTTDTPFGKAVQPLHFRRHTISAEVLATLLPEKWWQMSSADLAARTGKLCLPPHVLQHRALLTLPDGTPFSEVVETYTANVLASVRPALKDCTP